MTAVLDRVPPIGELPQARPLDNPFATGSSPITVATPSCCCSCCCCCLVTVATTIAYTATVSGAQSRRAGRPPAFIGLGGVLSVLAMPLGILAGMLVGQVVLEPVVIVGTMAVVMAASFAGGMVLLGAQPAMAITQAILVTLAASMAFVAEVVAALFTMFLIELLFPAGIALGVKWGKGDEATGAFHQPVWSEVRPEHEGLPDADRTWFLDRPRSTPRPDRRADDGLDDADRPDGPDDAPGADSRGGER